MADTGWQNLDSIMDGLFGAAVAASIAGASEVFDKTKGNLRNAAPVGGTKRTAHFGDPRIRGGRTREGGRTKSSITWASPDIDVVRVGDRGRIDIEATLVMAPQGFYQDGSAYARFIRPKNKKVLAWLSGTKAHFSKGVFVVIAGQHQGWISNALRQPVAVGSRVQAAWSRQFTPGGNIRPRRALVVSRGFADNSRTGAWFDSAYPREHIKDMPLRRALQARARRAGSSWEFRVNRAIGRFN